LDQRRGGITPDLNFTFSYAPRSSEGFPESLTINAKLLGTSINISLHKLDGFIANASLGSNVLIKNDTNAKISQLESENLVIASF
jgi:hypothetical protein